MSLYEQNLQSLIKKDPQLASQLFAIQSNEKFEVFVDEKDPLNVNIANISDATVLYEGIPIQQTQSDLTAYVEEGYQRYPFVYYYGLGNGVFFRALLQNELIHRIVIVEPEIELIYIALNFNDFTKDFESGRLKIVLSNEVDFAKAAEIFMYPEAKIFAKTYVFHTLLSYYESHFDQDIIRVNAFFVQALEHVVRGTGNNSMDALVGLQHHIANINKMIQTPTTLDLIKKSRNDETAVIVSTGPSLKKQLSLLKEIQHNVRILCIDASLPILEKEEIKPDIVFSLERIIETAKFYEETSKEFQEDVIFEVTSITHPDLFEHIKAGTLQISMRPFGYTRYFDLKDYGYLGIGMSAANMAYEYMFHAKFKTCILIGQDLAFGEDGSTHSDGHIYGSIEHGHNKREITEVLGYGGEKMVRTTLIWKLFKNFFETDIYVASQKGITTINATEGGARIDGTLEIPFSDAIEKYVDRTYQKEQIVLPPRDPHEIQKDADTVEKKIAQMLQYANRISDEIKETFLHVAKECEIIESTPKEKHYASLDYQRLADVMEEIDAVKAHFAEQMFTDIFIDATQALMVHQEIEIATIQVRNVKTDDERRQLMIDWILIHRYWLFSLAGLVQAVIEAINMGLEMRIELEMITCIRVEADGAEVDCLPVEHEDIFINNIFDLKEICIQYVLDSKDADKSDILRFYYSDEDTSFKVEVHMPTRSDPNFDEFRVYNSLVASIDNKLFEQNAKEKEDGSFVVGFASISDSEQHKALIDLVKDLYKNFNEITFKVICWNNEEQLITNYAFDNEMDRIQFITPVSIYELDSEIDLYIYSTEPLREPKLHVVPHILYWHSKNVAVPQLEFDDIYEPEVERDLDVVRVYVDTVLTHRAVIEVYKEDKKIDEIQGNTKRINNIYDVKQLCFEYLSSYSGNANVLEFFYVDKEKDLNVPIYMPSKDDEIYNEAAFKNSLQATIDHERLENLYEKNAIGFLATEENLEDEGFMDYIKDLLVKFPRVKFKAFYFNSKQIHILNSIFTSQPSFDLIKIRNIYELIGGIEVLVLPSRDELSDLSQFVIQNGCCQVVHFYIQDQKLNKQKLVNFPPIIPSSPQYNFLLQMGVLETKIKESKYNLYIAWFSDIYKNAGYLFDENLEYHEFSLTLLDITVTDNTMKKFMLLSQKKYYQTLGS